MALSGVDVDIGDLRIDAKYVRKIAQGIGGYIAMNISALDEGGKELKQRIGILKTDDIYDFHAGTVSGIVKLKKITPSEKTEGKHIIYIFDFVMQIIA